MIQFTLHNKLSESANFELGMPSWFYRVPDGGIMMMPTILENRIGTETAILLIDKTPFIYELAKIRPFKLMLKTGLLQTANGPLMFLVFHVPDPRNPQKPFVAIDNHINPFDPLMVATCRYLARQSHWHLVLVDGGANVIDLFEFENVYGLGETLDQVVEMCSGMPRGDFEEAKAEFCSLYTPEDLLQL